MTRIQILEEWLQDQIHAKKRASKKVFDHAKELHMTLARTAVDYLQQQYRIRGCARSTAAQESRAGVSCRAHRSRRLGKMCDEVHRGIRPLFVLRKGRAG